MTPALLGNLGVSLALAFSLLGLGLALLAGLGFGGFYAFMDRVEVVSAPGKGTSVTMKKKIGR